jgi:predicted nucleic acid-binding protein
VSPTLVDTGFIVALLDGSERNHRRCKDAPFRLEESSAAVRALMERYARVPMDFADACLVSLADSLGTGRILTLDSDFHVYRWRRTQTFELLVD